MRWDYSTLFIIIHEFHGDTSLEQHFRVFRIWRPTSPGAQPRLESWGGQHRGLGVGCGRGSSPPVVRVRGYPPGKFLKTQMLNPAFWWLLAVKFLAFWKPRLRSWGTNTLLAPNIKVGGPVSPGPYGCSTYVWLDVKPCSIQSSI